jgi:hypothetical protein
MVRVAHLKGEDGELIKALLVQHGGLIGGVSGLKFKGVLHRSPLGAHPESVPDMVSLRLGLWQ